jgi:hypothetical protein
MKTLNVTIILITALLAQACVTTPYTQEEWEMKNNAVAAFGIAADNFRAARTPSYQPSYQPYQAPVQYQYQQPTYQPYQAPVQQEAPLFGQGSLFNQ